MNNLKDSSEIEECAALLQGLMLPEGLRKYVTFDPPEPASVTDRHGGRQLLDVENSGDLVTDAVPSLAPPEESVAEVPTPGFPELSLEPLHKEDMLKQALQILCQRGGFSSAIIADDNGLALADYNSPVGIEVLAAFATVLGGAIAQASHFLDQREANNISMDINYADKAVVRKFEIRGVFFYLFIICPQDVDERNEVELSMETLTNLINR